jgi:arylsulfatase A-like enzyme
VIYMSDNGFSLGEHGLIDKRHAYEESIRVPMLAWAPGFIAPGLKVSELVRNIDVAPTILELAGVPGPGDMDGRSVLKALRGRAGLEPVELLYEYYWEYAFPHTPTVFALRGDRYKYIYFHGIWDLDEFYDLTTDSLEQHNLMGCRRIRGGSGPCATVYLTTCRRLAGCRFRSVAATGRLLSERRNTEAISAGFTTL